MTDLIKTLTVLAILVILLRRRIYLGTVMRVGALVCCGPGPVLLCTINHDFGHCACP